MSFWQKLFGRPLGGGSGKNEQIIEEPEHEIQEWPVEELTVAKDKNNQQKEIKENNKDSPP
jgi:hypothetical protein